MNSETPKDSASSSHHHAVHTKDATNSETPGSLGLESLEPLDADFDSGDGYDADSNDNDGNFLMPHERKLSLAEQRQLLAMRRRPDDEVDLEEMDVRSGRRHWEEQHKARVIGPDGIPIVAGAADPAKQETPPVSETPAAVVETVLVAPGETVVAASGETVLLNETDHPNKPLYEAVLQGVGSLDASKVSLTGTEQINVAGALTASMAQTPGFQQQNNPDPAAISIVASENGDRVFAINSQNPGAPNALYTSVEVELVRNQSLQASSAQIALSASESVPPKPAQEQALSSEQLSPRSIA